MKKLMLALLIAMSGALVFANTQQQCSEASACTTHECTADTCAPSCDKAGTKEAKCDNRETASECSTCTTCTK